MKRWQFVLVVSLITAAGLTAAALRFGRQASPAVSPFIAVYEQVVYRSGQSVPVGQRTFTLAVRSDGATMQANATNDQVLSVPRSVELKDKYIVVDPLTESVTSYAPYRPMVVPTRDCGGRPDTPIFGIPTEVVEEVLKDKNGQPFSKVTKWVGVDMNCQSLREVDIRSQLRTELNAISVTLGEPPAEYFAVPARYQERGPAETDAEAKRRGQVGIFGSPEVADKLQKAYEAKRPPQ